MNLPNIEPPDPGTACDYCGAELNVSPDYCDVCTERIRLEKVRESGNEYRRDAQFRMDMEHVQARTRLHLGRNR